METFFYFCSSGESVRSKGLRRSIGGAPLSNSSRPGIIFPMNKNAVFGRKKLEMADEAVL